MSASSGNLQDIYRQKVLDHSRHPHNFRRPDKVDREATGFNPLCGDKVSVYLQVADNTIRQAAFEGTGCAICIASASILTDALCGQSIVQAQQLITAVNRMFSENAAITDPALADMEALSSVRDYPSRVKCATLAWTTVSAALNGKSQPVSTEY